LIHESQFYDQFAFIPLKGRGCVSALLSIYGTALEHIDAGKYVNLLLIDFSKAFDRAATSRIINQLHHLNASKQCILWIADFLQNRRVFVKYDNECSDTCSISGGTPQGSLISPLLFAMLCESLKPLNENFTYVKYADDLTVVHNTASPSNYQDLQDETNHIVNWCTFNRMLINERKTKNIHVCIRKAPSPPQVLINNSLIENVTSSKLLGVYIHSSLKWHEHVDFSIKKAAKLIFPLLQLKRSKLDKPLLLKLYQLLVRPHLTYASPVTINMGQSNELKLLKMERRFLSLIGTKPNESLPLHVDRLCLHLARKVLQYEQHPVRKLLQTVSHRKTRSQKELIRPLAKTTLKKNSFIRYFL